MTVQALIQIAKNGWLIGSPMFLMTVLVVGVSLLLIRRWSRAGRWWLTAWAVAYLLWSSPIVAQLMTAPLSGAFEPLRSREQARNADVVVMLGGGIHPHTAGGWTVDDLNASALRVLETARLYALLEPRTVIVSGGNTTDNDPPRPEARAYAAALMSLGVPKDRIVVEDQSRTTREEAVILRPVLLALGAKTFVLVTALPHMRRSMRVFEAQGLVPIASPAALMPEKQGGRSAFVPSSEALGVSGAAVYEYGANLYYWIRGWI